jgi:hypothetical protein
MIYDALEIPMKKDKMKYMTINCTTVNQFVVVVGYIYLGTIQWNHGLGDVGMNLSFLTSSGTCKEFNISTDLAFP